MPNVGWRVSALVEVRAHHDAPPAPGPPPSELGVQWHAQIYDYDPTDVAVPNAWHFMASLGEFFVPVYNDTTVAFERRDADDMSLVATIDALEGMWEFSEYNFADDANYLFAFSSYDGRNVLRLSKSDWSHVVGVRDNMAVITPDGL